jgi:hypothetical protein
MAFLLSKFIFCLLLVFYLQKFSKGNLFSYKNYIVPIQVINGRLTSFFLSQRLEILWKITLYTYRHIHYTLLLYNVSSWNLFLNELAQKNV